MKRNEVTAHTKKYCVRPQILWKNTENTNGF